jgi:6-phosphogluconate dehydrogenase
MIIIIMGVSGSGKTSLGKLLSSALSMPFYDADDFHSSINKSKMKSGLALSDLDRGPWLHQLAEKIYEWSSNEGAILACSALKEDYRKILSKYQVKISWIVLNGPFDLIQSRLKKRKNHFFNSELLKSQLDSLEVPQYGIHLDIDQSLDHLVQSYLSATHIHEFAEIGIIGMGVMGQNLALNFAENKIETAVYNRASNGEEKIVSDFMSNNSRFQNINGFTDIKSFIHALKRPRKIWLMIKSGLAIDSLIDEIVPLLNQGDLIIDGGNSYFEDTQRRGKLLEKKQIDYAGIGVSGGEVGARYGASLMFGGNKKAYEVLSPMLSSISAKDKSKIPCQAYFGKGGAGHFVKMVHNGIEYSEMQLLAEVYAILSHQLSYPEMAILLQEWNKGPAASYLLEMTAKILQKKEGEQYLLDLILDSSASKGTGIWATKSAIDLGEVNTMMSSALFSRFLSNMKMKRASLSEMKPLPKKRASFDLVKLRKAYQFARIINHIQGFNLINAASKKYGWNCRLSEIARVWSNGCIIRSQLMEDLMVSFAKSPSIIEHKKILEILTTTEPYLADLIHHVVDQKIALDSFSSAFNYWIALTTEKLPANLVQALRDYFGAHTYQRIDKPSTEIFHTKWDSYD